MKILFINKYDITGGAGIAALRLHKALVSEYHTEDKFLVGIKKSHLNFVSTTRKSGIQNLIERGVNFLSSAVGLQYKFFPFSSHSILKTIKDFSPDIISLHNTHGGYFKTSLLKEISKTAPVVWTLHDMWAFTGNAAHTFGDNSWKEMKSGKGESKNFPRIGINTGNYLLRKKKEIYLKSNLTIVTPSNWLYAQAKQSPALSGKKIIRIANGIDLNVFSQKNKIKIKEKLGIPNEEKVIMFGAEKILNNSYKGGNDLIRILEILNGALSTRIHLIVMGLTDKKYFANFKNFVIHGTGYVSSEEKVAEIITAADLFIYPTKADNLPNALIEACACGTPCVSFDIGGCNEIIKDGFNGFLISPFEYNKFAEKVKKCLEDGELLKYLSANARQVAEEQFDVKLMAQNYYSLFRSLL